MKKFSLILILMSLVGCLIGCASKSADNYIPVESITTDEPTIIIEENETKSLDYLIYPENATNKDIYIDYSKLNGVAAVTIQTTTEVAILGLTTGNGILSLYADNKYVSYDITVVPYNPHPLPPEPGTTDAADINSYVNAQLIDYGLETEHIINDERGGVYLVDGWYLMFDFAASTDDSLENLRKKVYTVKSFLPDFLLKFNETYRVASAEIDSAQYTLVMVNSNITAVATLYGFIDNSAPHVELFIYNYHTNGGIYA